MNLMRYLLEANLYLAAFYLLYLFLLRKETYYQLSRAYLLASSMLAFVIPLLQLGILKPENFTTVSVVPAFDPREFQNLAVVAAPVPVHVWSVFDYCLLVYGIITAVLLINLGIKIFKLIRLSKQNARQANGEFILIEIDSESAAFSFFSYLFIDTKLASSQTVIRHEEVHIRQKHSWDIIYLELLKVINWFNPFVYLLQNSIKEVHEYIADEHTAELENSHDNYASFLISNAYGMAQSGLTNSFSGKNMLRKRIIMLYRERSGRLAKLKYLLALPLICGLLCLSTMAFTDKSYGFDILPQHVQMKLAHFKLHKIFARRDTNISIKNADPAQIDNGPITTVAPDKPDTINIDTVKAKKEPLIIVNGKVLPPSDKTVLDGKYKLSDKISRLADINPADIASISVLKDKSATAIYGDAGANGVILITTKDHTAITDTNKVISGAIKREVDAVRQKELGSDVVFTAVEIEPTPAGGMAAFYKFLGSTIRYPAEDRKNSTQGRVIVQFIVEKDGSLSNMKVMRAPSATLGEEAVRALKLAPNWIPGVQNGRPVRVQYTIPVNFSLGDDGSSFDAFYKQLGNKIKYPKEAKEKENVGRMLVVFSLDADKQIKDVRVLRGFSKVLDDEVIKNVQNCKELPNGKPGTTYLLPVFFALQDANGKYIGTTQKDKDYVENTAPPEPKYFSLSQVTITSYKN